MYWVLTLSGLYAQKPVLPAPGGVPNAYGALEAMSGDALLPFYNQTACGLNYTAGAVILTKRATWQGGVTQPAPITISGIPCKNASIEKAFLYWSIETTVDTSWVKLKNPNQLTQTFVGEMIGESNGKCWSCFGTRHYRADVTSIIAGNGNYIVSGLPANAGCGDTDGAMLVIIYRDLAATYTGTFVLYDGNITNAAGTSATMNLSGFNVCEPPALAEGFVTIADLQSNVAGPWQITINNVAQNVPPLFFNFEQRTINLIPGQNSSTMGVNTFTTDCYSWLNAGLYYRTQNCNSCPIDSALLAQGGAYLSGKTVLCSPNDTARLQVNALGGIVQWQRAFSPFSNWQNIPNQLPKLTVTNLTQPTRYRVRLNAGANCPDFFSNELTVSPKNFQIQAQIAHPTCVGSLDGKINLQLANARKPYTIQWQKQNDPNFIANDTILTNLSVGTYLLTFMDADSCVATDTYTLTAPPPVQLNFNPFVDTFIVCNSNQLVELTLPPTTQVVHWEIAQKPYNNWQILSTNSTTFTLDNITTDTRIRAYVQANSGNCLNDYTNTKQIYFSGLTLSATLKPISCNAGNDAEIITTINGGKPPYQYQWTSSNPNFSANTATISHLTPGKYYLRVVEQSGCSVRDTFEIVAPTLLSWQTIIEAESCANNGGQLTVIPTGGTPPFQYLWQDLNQLNLSTQPTVNGLIAGTYQLTLTDAASCIEKDTLIVTALAGTQIIPPILVNQLTANIRWYKVDGALYRITYYPNGGNGITIDNISDTTYTISGLLPDKIYQVRVQAYCPGGLTTPHSAWEDFVSPPVSVCPPPQIIAVLPVPGAPTEADVAWVDVPGAICYELQYRTPNSAWTPIAVPIGINPYRVTGLVPNTQYRFRLRAFCNQCNGGLPSNYSNIKIYLSPDVCTLKNFTLNNGRTTIIDCDSTLLQPDIPPQPNYSYQWKYNNTNIPNANAYTYIAKLPGVYQLIIQEDTCPPALSQKVQVSFSDVQILSVVAVTPPTCATCTDGSLSVTAITSGQGNIPPYLYSIDGINFQPNHVFDGLAIGTYTLSIKIANSFCSVTRIVEVSPSCTPDETFITSLTGVTTQEAVVNWYALQSCAETYSIRYRVLNTQNWIEINGLVGISYLFNNLVAGTTYELSVCGVSNVGVKGSWSPIKQFTTLNNTVSLCLPPTGIKSNAITTNAATISWQNAAGTQGIEVQYRLNNNAWQTLALSNTQSVVLTNLIPNRTYTYRLRAKCGNSNYSIYTPIYNFKTLATREAYLFAGNEEVVLYPNPGSGHFTIFNRKIDLPMSLVVYDASGRALLSDLIPLGETQHTIDLSDRPAGVYLLKYYVGANVKYVKLFKHN